VPSEILTKPGHLTDLERDIIRTHCRVAYDILKTIEFPYPVAQIILQHHERMDGSGYPQGLKGEEILFAARIIGTADVIDAMASHRPYRPALGVDSAIKEIVKYKGILYDSTVVDTCLKIYKTAGKAAFAQAENSEK
jgi:HD-GYP domain-containing protein (c-di-GMP phosphodiesterase class II)